MLKLAVGNVRNEKEVGSSGQQTDFKRGEKTKVKGYKKMKCLSITAP